MQPNPLHLPTARELSEFQCILADCSYDLETRGLGASAERLAELLAWLNTLAPPAQLPGMPFGRLD